MRYDVEIGGATRHVTVVRTGDGLAVTLEGQTFQIDAVRIDGQTLSLLVDTVWPDDGSPMPSRTAAVRAVHDVNIAPAPGGTPGALLVRIGTTPVAVTVDGRRRARGVAMDAASGPQRLVAPMPGKVVRVLAAAGDVVTRRQPLVVVEAMKMENELRADRDGTVAEVHAREGQLVDAGALLVVIQ